MEEFYSIDLVLKKLTLLARFNLGAQLWIRIKVNQSIY